MSTSLWGCNEVALASPGLLLPLTYLQDVQVAGWWQSFRHCGRSEFWRHYCHLYNVLFMQPNCKILSKRSANPNTHHFFWISVHSRYLRSRGVNSSTFWFIHIKHMHIICSHDYFLATKTASVYFNLFFPSWWINASFTFESEQRCFEYDQQGADFTQELLCNSPSLSLGKAWESTDRIWRLLSFYWTPCLLIMPVGANCTLRWYKIPKCQNLGAREVLACLFVCLFFISWRLITL